MGFMTHLNTPVSGLTAQRLRMDVIGQNIANAITTETEAGGPYRRQVTLFSEVKNFKNINTSRGRQFGEVLSKTLAERKELKNGGVQVLAVVKKIKHRSPLSMTRPTPTPTKTGITGFLT